MQAVWERVQTVARSHARVLILGETGTGKELVARALHAISSRHSMPFIAVNCGAFAAGIIESELFGHVRGAFTGADAARSGCIQRANGGTLFLDEIGELALSAQAKLLRVLQEGVLLPVGSEAPVTVDVRVISATHRNLRAEVAAGRFREDLFFRLAVLQIAIPALRQRLDDVPALVDRLIERHRPHGVASRMTSAALAALRGYSFPGNVRELENIVQHALVMADGADIEPEHLPESVTGRFRQPPPPVPGPTADSGLPLAVARANFERAYILDMLERHQGRRSETARALGISRKSLWCRLTTYLDGNSPDPDAADQQEHGVD